MNDIQYITKQIDTDTGILYSWFGAMHTRIDIVMYDSMGKDLKHIAVLIYNKVKELEKTASYFDAESELSYVNRTASKTPVAISGELYSIISKALYYNKITSGYFDITIHSENHDAESCSKIILENNDSIIYFRQDGIKINLSGFIKGYTLDSIRQILRESAITNALINIGNSSVMAIGSHPRGKGWKVKAENQTDDIHLIDKCLTTSGNNRPERKHIIDPHSNQYIEGVKSTSVVTNTASEGEALSTALFAAGTFGRKQILQNFNATVFDY